MKKIIIEVNSKTNEEYLHELWYNARYGGREGTQLEWWNEENWVIALKGYIKSMHKQFTKIDKSKKSF